MEKGKSLLEVISSAVDKKNDNSFDSIYKSAQRYLNAIINSVGININTLKRRGCKSSDNHIIGEKLEKIIKSHIGKQKYFPSRNQILKCTESEPTQLTLEVIDVIKLYLKDNFTEDVISELSQKINAKLNTLISNGKEKNEWHNTEIKKHTESIEEINTLIDKIRENMVSLKFRTIQTIQDLHEAIYGVYYFIEKYSPDETPYLTEDELIIIDFIRLNKILSNIYKDIQTKNSIISLSLKK